MKYLRTFSIICFLGLLFSTCTKKENYPDYPVITYNNWEPFCSGSTTDSAYLLVNFTDGNGAIGYPSEDASAPNDFYIVPLFDSAGIFKSLSVSTQTGGDSSITFPYQIPDITPSGSDKELNGIIQINLETAIQAIIQIPVDLASRGFVAGTFRFEVWMYDRAGNKSNVLITPTVYTCQ
jgi:hypothetical protein